MLSREVSLYERFSFIKVRPAIFRFLKRKTPAEAFSLCPHCPSMFLLDLLSLPSESAAG